MGFTKPDLPDVDPDTFMQKPLMERMRILATDWVDNGFGSPRMVHTIYIAKLVLFYALGGILVATLTSGLPVLSCFAVVEPADRLPEGRSVDGPARTDRRRRIVGPAGRQDQADDRRHPVLGPPRHIRLRPWKWVPFTDGDRRTWFDVGLYIVLMISVAVAAGCCLGCTAIRCSAAMPDNTSGLVNPALLIAPIVLLVVMGLRDKIVFLAARGEQYLPALIFFAAFCRSST